MMGWVGSGKTSVGWVRLDPKILGLIEFSFKKWTNIQFYR